MTLLDCIVGITPGGGPATPITVYPSINGAMAVLHGPTESIYTVYVGGFDQVGLIRSFVPTVFGGAGSAIANSYAGF